MECRQRLENRMSASRGSDPLAEAVDLEPFQLYFVCRPSPEYPCRSDPDQNYKSCGWLYALAAYSYILCSFIIAAVARISILSLVFCGTIDENVLQSMRV